MLPILSGCTIWDRVFHHDKKNGGCTEKPFAQNTENRPLLKVPEGLSAPDTRNAIKIPDLTSPERLRTRNEPCLSRPPNYFSKPLNVNLPAPPKPKRWWQFWRKTPPPPAAAPAAAAPAPAPPPPLAPASK
jgi:hypothetical protein